ncbi:MAG: 2Fe-2S iron-sulfur cluster binding domain-containing protein [Saprospiraceae bacterium]|nr:2Fe-2S iron-sulfur cluster binding domain-containing protein [Saprospiraceae bacterium]
MSSNFYKINVHQINAETPDCVQICFDIPTDLTKNFEFLPGQYVNVRTYLDGEEVRRSYSICSSPGEDKLCVAVKKIHKGKFSTYANTQLKAGDELELMPPMGNFVLPSDLSQTDTVVFYCAGSGITPAMSMMKYILEEIPEINVILYYGNKHTESIIFREELEGLKNRFLKRLSIHYVLSQEALDSPLFCGRIDKEKCRIFESQLNPGHAASLYYLCGPATMVFDIKESLLELGISENRVHFELFTTAGMEVPKEQKPAESAEKSHSTIKMKLDGLEFEFDFDGSCSNILDAALKNGADLPFACKGGVCSTCKAHCDEGEVSMAVNYALEADEVAAGYILTCQSYPRSKEVYINFDK